MARIIFITGASGVGKSTMVSLLRSLLGKDFCVHDFDERGVPENVDNQWRIDETQHWLRQGRDNVSKGVSTVICGLSRPSEVESNLASVDFIFLDAEDEIIKQRLLKRYQSSDRIQEIERSSGKSVGQFIEDSLMFSRLLRDEAKQYGLKMIDTSRSSADQVSKRVVGYILHKR